MQVQEMSVDTFLDEMQPAVFERGWFEIQKTHLFSHCLPTLVYHVSDAKNSIPGLFLTDVLQI